MLRRSEQFKDGEQIEGTTYRVATLIGSGGMGSVYEVEHLELGRNFVLKALHGHLSSRSDLVGRMRNEWRALARLNHPNIVQVTDAGQTSSGLPYYVMEKLEGGTVGQLLSEHGKLSVIQAGRILVDVLRGLDAAHQTGAIHRDIKPQNIFVLPNGTAKLLDFGIAKLRDQVAKVVTAGGVSIGTPRYMAPEQAEGGRVDGRADIYAAALVLYEVLLGRGPFAQIRDPNELVMAHIGVEPERADFLDASIPAEMGDLLQRWLSKDPASRPLRASLAADELSSILKVLPEEREDPTDVTQGGDYDAATVGPSESGANWSAPARVSGRRTPLASKTSKKTSQVVEHASRLSGAPESSETGETRTRTLLDDSEDARKGTIGFGTAGDYEKTSNSGSGRPSKTPPPISENAASRELRPSNARSFTSLVIAGTAIGSFAVALAVIFLAPREKGEPANAEPGPIASGVADDRLREANGPVVETVEPAPPGATDVSAVQDGLKESSDPEPKLPAASRRELDLTTATEPRAATVPKKVKKSPEDSDLRPRESSKKGPMPGSGLW